MQQNDNDAILVDNVLHVSCNGENETAVPTATAATAAAPAATIQLNNGQTTVAAIVDIDDSSAPQITPDIFATDMNESVSITKCESTTFDDSNAMCYSPSWSMHLESNEQRQKQIHEEDDEEREEEVVVEEDAEDLCHDVIECCDTIMPSSPPALPTSLKFNRNTMSISVKRTAIKMADQLKRRRSFGRQHMRITPNESIICSPQFEHLDDVDANDLHANIGQAMRNHFGQLNENYANPYHHTSIDDIDNGDCDAAADDDDGAGGADGGGGGVGRKMAKDQRQSSRLLELIRSKDQLRSAVVLRSPRGNQPRTYTTDALYSALMDVKSGESIYRASQIHGVPRKTLRNWMKRWHIKSVYPMPYQLKKAAEKKRQIVGKQNDVQPTTSSTVRIDLSESETNEY